MSLEQHRVVFIIVTATLVLIVASPSLTKLLVLPRTEFFTELWILGPNHKAEDYPFNITRNFKYNLFLGIGNFLGYCAYYLVEIKFCNQTQSSPDSFNRTPSNLRPLLSITAFVSDKKIWELPLTFSFDYGNNELLSQIEFYNVTLNGVAIDMRNYLITWNSTKNEFRGDLFFELWIYNSTIGGFQYHKRFVNLVLNMTI